MNILIRTLLALCLLLPGYAQAQATDASRAEATRLLDALDMQATLDQTLELSLDAQIATNKELAPYRAVMLGFFRKYMSYESLKPQLVTIYAEAFSAAELAEIRAWYQGPTGRKAMRILPSLMQKGSEMGQSLVQAHLPELLQLIQAESERQKAAAKP